MLTLLPANPIYILFLFAVNSNANTYADSISLKGAEEEKRHMP